MTARWAIDAAGATHPGQRSHNEDSWCMEPASGLYVVADGVGGRDAGEVASRIACEVTAEKVREGRALGAAFKAANAAIQHAIERAGAQAASMASTAVALQLLPDSGRFAVAWAGDSRLYLWDGALKSLTRDHSLVESLLQRGEISRAEADTHPRRNVILVALGDTQNDLEPGENGGSLPASALFLLCSDGLTDCVPADRLCAILSRRGDTLQQRADALVAAAVDAGGRDNITALLVSCDDHAVDPVSSGTREDPVIYETFDPVSGERTRDSRDDRSAPTIRRVPARTDETGTRVATAGTLPALPRKPAQRSWRRGGWWLLAAAALFAGGLWLIDLVARHGS